MYITPLLDLIKQQNRNMAGKYAKAALLDIETSPRLRKLDPTTYQLLRKIILDRFNDQHREFTELIDGIAEPN